MINTASGHGIKTRQPASDEKIGGDSMHALRNAISVVGISTVLAQRLLTEGDSKRGAYYVDQAVKGCENALCCLKNSALVQGDRFSQQGNAILRRALQTSIRQSQITFYRLNFA